MNLMDNDYFIKDCYNCEYIEILSIEDNTIIDKMFCGLSGYEILNRKLLCKKFKISESAKIVHRISKEDVERIESEIKM